MPEPSSLFPALSCKSRLVFWFLLCFHRSGGTVTAAFHLAPPFQTSAALPKRHYSRAKRRTTRVCVADRPWTQGGSLDDGEHDNSSSSNNNSNNIHTTDRDDPTPPSNPSPPSSSSWSITEALRTRLWLPLTRLALRDYEWRSSVFRSLEADRQIEESLARLQGQSAPNYVRPMDATEEKIGPLGRLERALVSWIAQVVDEEGRRAQTILDRQGQLVRPMELRQSKSESAVEEVATPLARSSSNNNNNNNSDEEELGPLGYMERQASDFLARIRAAEETRVATQTRQPKDLPSDVRGPLGTLEAAVSAFWRELRDSELLRAELQARGGDVVRPIDVPGPLGEWESRVAALWQAEERRAMERDHNEGKVVRPKDARYPGPLGEWEKGIYDWLYSLRVEENERLQSIQRLLQDKRPMEQNRTSLLGVAEALVVGILRAPQLVVSVFERVRELLQSETLSSLDEELGRQDDRDALVPAPHVEEDD